LSDIKNIKYYSL